jgi:DNA-binding FrmR family transcriptional regulator
MQQTNIKSHLNRISGQVNGIGKMIERQEDSTLVIAQIMAAKGSLEKLAIRILKEESKKCSKGNVDKLVDILFKVN